MTNNSTKREVKYLLDSFNQNNVNYCILRSFQFLKSGKFAGDIDILIFQDNINAAKKILTKEKYTQIFSGPIPGHIVYRKFLSRSSRFLTVDLHCSGLTHDGILYLPEENISKNKITFSGSWIPGVTDYIVALILHSIIDKCYFKKNYKKEIIRFIEKPKNLHKLQENLTTILPENISRIIISSLKNLKWELVLKTRKRLLFYSVFRHPLGLLNFFLINTNRILRVINPFYYGRLIAMVGPDGSGKSSTSEKLAERLKSGQIRTKTIYMGWRESMLPFLSNLMKTDKAIFKSNSHELASKNRFLLATRSIMITLLYTVELYLRFLFKILPALKSGSVIITDRYFYDRIALDNSLPLFLKKIYLYIIPKPSLTFYFTAEPKILCAREKNLPKAVLAKQYLGFESTYKMFSAKRLDTDTNNTQKIVNIIMKGLFGRIN